MHDKPLAASSWSLSIGGSELRRTASADRRGLEEAHDGDGEGAREQCGDVVDRRCDRRRQARRHGRRSGRRRARRSRRRRRARCRRTTATSGPGTAGANRRRPRRTAIVTAEKATVVQLMSPRCSMTPRTSAKKLSAAGSPAMPSSLGSWPAATVRPTPTLMPVRVASEMLSISVPRRSTRATSRITPTSSVSVARSPAGSSLSAATPAASSVEPVSDGDGRRRADRERPRPAEQRVHRHRHHARVQPDLDGRSAMVA